VLVVDDTAAVLRATAALPRGVGDGLLEVVRASGVPLACAGSARDLRPLGVSGLTVRLGQDEERVARRREPAAVPGRGVREADGATCQVALPAARVERRTGSTRLPAQVAARLPLRVAPLPLPADDLGPGRAPWAVPLGRGGDDAGVLTADLDRGLLVCGPAGSGRTGVLDIIEAHLPDGVTAVRPGPRDLPEAVLGRPGPGAGRRVLLLDDVDLTVRDRPDLDERLASWVLAAEAGDQDAPRVVATARTDRVAAAFRGVLAALRSAGGALVCDPLAPGSAEAVGCDLSRACDPRRVPGRAVLVVRGSAVPLQLARPGASKGR
jgi:S-DNA-T family DNA segregation ATPase FtsK/SpoIIIE